MRDLHSPEASMTPPTPPSGTGASLTEEERKFVDEMSVHAAAGNLSREEARALAIIIRLTRQQE